MCATADLIPGTKVWLAARTATAPGICYRQPRATVVNVAADGHGFVVVEVDNATYRVHRDNIRRSEPAPEPHRRPAPSRPRMVLPDGYEEVALW